MGLAYRKTRDLFYLQCVNGERKESKCEGQPDPEKLADEDHKIHTDSGRDQACEQPFRFYPYLILLISGIFHCFRLWGKYTEQAANEQDELWKRRSGGFIFFIFRSEAALF